MSLCVNRLQEERYALCRICKIPLHYGDIQVDTIIGNNGVRIIHSGSLLNLRKAHKAVLIS